MNTRIKKIRQQLNLTQQAFAERIGMKQNSIALIESGKRNISDQAILSICREFKVNEKWIKTGEGEMFVPSNDSPLDALAEEKKLSQNERLLLERFLNLSPEARQGILSYITGIAAALASDAQSSNSTSIDGQMKEMSVEEAEAEYIKNVLNSAPKKVSSASSTINGDKTDEKHA